MAGAEDAAVYPIVLRKVGFGLISWLAELSGQLDAEHQPTWIEFGRDTRGEFRITWATR